MTTSVPNMSVAVDVPQSPKKRKIVAETPTKSKKRRKHAEPQSQTAEELPTATQSSSTTGEKKPKRKNKDKHKDQVDVEMLDEEAPEVAMSQTVAEETPVQESIDVEGELEPDTIENVDESFMTSQDLTCFQLKRISFYVPIPGISLASSTSSLLSLHLAPLLLTYFPPAGGVVISFHDPVLSARAEIGVNTPLRPPTSGQIPRNPPDETFAQCADQFGVCWVWLTVSLLVFAPQPGDQFKGWANIQSESFIGLVSYNYFQTSVLKNRIPRKWTFDGPSREQTQKRKSKKVKLQGESEDAHDTQHSSQNNDRNDSVAVDVSDGTFIDEDGNRILRNQLITVNDIDMTPGSERNRYGLQIDGSLLSPEEESAVLKEEKAQYHTVRDRRSRTQTPALDDVGGIPLMSGGIQIP